MTVANTASGGTLRATAVCTAGSQPLRVPVTSGDLAAGQSAKAQAFPPPGCTGAAVVLSSSSRTTADPTASVLRDYSVSTGPPTAPLAVTLAGTGAGVVTSDKGNILCGSACTDSFGLGTQVTLAAVPTSTSTFAGWTGACSGTTAQCTVTVNDAAAVTATFNAIPGTVKPPASETSQLEQDLASDTKGPRIGIGKVALARKLKALTLRVTCPATEPHRCSGFVAVVVRAGKKRLNLGQRAFLELKGGRRKVLRYPLTARSRSIIRRARSLRVSLRARTRDDAFNYVSQRRKLEIDR